jgi:hypothetical protein
LFIVYGRAFTIPSFLLSTLFGLPYEISEAANFAADLYDFMITGIPQNKLSIRRCLRCGCGERYIVLIRDGMGEVEARAKARAEMIKATFVDARSIPLLQCEAERC